jgi:hypothetical protein
MNQAAARIPNVVTETLLDHGETDTRPMPAPSISSARDRADATTAPAIIAPHDTADAPLSGLASSSCAFKIASERAFNAALEMKSSWKVGSEVREGGGVSDREER